MLNSKIKNALKAAFVCFTFLLATLNCCLTCSASAPMPKYPKGSNIIFDGRSLFCSKNLPLIGKTAYEFLPTKDEPDPPVIILPEDLELKEENRQHMKVLSSQEYLQGQWANPSELSSNSMFFWENRFLMYSISYPICRLIAYAFSPKDGDPNYLVLTLPEGMELKEENRKHMKYMSADDLLILRAHMFELHGLAVPVREHTVQPNNQGLPTTPVENIQQGQQANQNGDQENQPQPENNAQPDEKESLNENAEPLDVNNEQPAEEEAQPEKQENKQSDEDDNNQEEDFRKEDEDGGDKDDQHDESESHPEQESKQPYTLAIEYSDNHKDGGDSSTTNQPQPQQQSRRQRFKNYLYDNLAALNRPFVPPTPAPSSKSKQTAAPKSTNIDDSQNQYLEQHPFIKFLCAFFTLCTFSLFFGNSK